jgi:hypothetical protein
MLVVKQLLKEDWSVQRIETDNDRKYHRLVLHIDDLLELARISTIDTTVNEDGFVTPECLQRALRTKPQDISTFSISRRFRLEINDFIIKDPADIIELLGRERCIHRIRLIHSSIIFSANGEEANLNIAPNSDSNEVRLFRRLDAMLSKCEAGFSLRILRGVWFFLLAIYLGVLFVLVYVLRMITTKVDLILTIIGVLICNYILLIPLSGRYIKIKGLGKSEWWPNPGAIIQAVILNIHQFSRE